MSLIVTDINLTNCQSSRYDLALFSSGYEARCVHAPKQFETTNISETRVLGFSQLKSTTQRCENDSYYLDHWHQKPILLSGDDDSEIYRQLCNLSSCMPEEIRLLVDYSSMSRLWYAAVINWARFVPRIKSVEIDFIYSIGRYERTLIPMVINDILAIPGCEGGSLRFTKAVAVFGLGFYSMMTHCVWEHLLTRA